MILRDGTDTREEVQRPGPYCDGMAVVLSSLDWCDATAGNFPDTGMAERFGRRVLWTDTQGFRESSTFATWADARDAIAAHYPDDWADWADEVVAR